MTLTVKLLAISGIAQQYSAQRHDRPVGKTYRKLKWCSKHVSPGLLATTMKRTGKPVGIALTKAFAELTIQRKHRKSDPC